MEDKLKFEQLEELYEKNPEYSVYYQNLASEINENILNANPEVKELIEEFNSALAPKQEAMDKEFLRMNKLMLELNEASENFDKKSQELEAAKNELLNSEKFAILQEVEEVVYAQIDSVLADPKHPYNKIYLKEQELVEDEE